MILILFPHETLADALLDPARPATLFTSHALSTTLPKQLAAKTDIPLQAGYFPLEVEHLPLTDGVLFLQNAKS